MAPNPIKPATASVFLWDLLWERWFSLEAGAPDRPSNRRTEIDSRQWKAIAVKRVKRCMKHPSDIVSIQINQSHSSL